MATKSKNLTLELVDISLWHDTESIMDRIRPEINKVTERRWLAFSMPDGYVYVQPQLLAAICRELAEQAGDHQTANAGEELMRKVMLSVITRLAQDVPGALADNLFQTDRYFCGRFLVENSNGRSYFSFQIPFRAAAFGSIAELETRKSGNLRRVTGVKPEYPLSDKDQRQKERMTQRHASRTTRSIKELEEARGQLELLVSQSLHGDQPTMQSLFQELGNTLLAARNKLCRNSPQLPGTQTSHNDMSQQKEGG